jgi:hypothetical protein
MPGQKQTTAIDLKQLSAKLVKRSTGRKGILIILFRKTIESETGRFEFQATIQRIDTVQ